MVQDLNTSWLSRAGRHCDFAGECQTIVTLKNQGSEEPLGLIGVQTERWSRYDDVPKHHGPNVVPYIWIRWYNGKTWSDCDLTYYIVFMLERWREMLDETSCIVR